jgi:hypothetical protein
LLAVISALTLCPVLITLTVVWCTSLCSAFNKRYTSSKGFFPLKPSHYFTAVEQLDRFHVDVGGEAFVHAA